jgi:vacuolar-type H+-ATPase subunit I/STV1
MKLSVIMGIVHMTIGVIIKGTNNVFWRDWPSLIFEVIAGLVLLLGLFGWMDLLIYSKWFFPINYADNLTTVSVTDPVTKLPTLQLLGDMANRLTPSVINIMITTVFSGGSPPANDPTMFAFMVSGDDKYNFPP